MDAVEEVKSRLSIEDVVGEYVQLKRAGRNWRGLSPFTSEQTPSFMVSPEKQIWHDFSSGKGGNMFSFVMEVEGLDFKGALELLARKAGIDIEQYRDTKRPGGPDKERLHTALETATKFYQVQFSRNKTALEYVLKTRQFSKETALEWRLGYAPNTGTALVDYLKKQGFTEQEIKQAGLSAQRYRGLGDMFRGRLMIPLQDPQGRVIGFTARLLDDAPDQPKYINTPQTVLYDKSRHVYGLHLAKESIRKSQFVVLAEGNLDVIASHQAGVRQVVATAGTALTEPHLKALSRFTGDIRLAFDADRAGLAATERAIPIASRVHVNLSVITIPSGKDPDELIRRDAAQWQHVIQSHVYALDWLMERYQRLLNIDTAEGKRQFSDVLLPVVRSLNDPVEQDHYLIAIAERIGVGREALETKLKQTEETAQPQRRRRIKTEPPQLNKADVENRKLQDHYLSLLLMRQPLREYVTKIEPEMLFSEQAQQLFVFLRDNPDFTGQPEQATKLRNLLDYVKILGLEYEELYQGLELTELRYEAARLQARLVEQFVKKQKQMLATKLEGADEATINVLLEQAKQYDALLKDIQGGLHAQRQDT
ncbi:MAG TPA: DNA primase [Candidatus Saccharimonadales bacterium]|nr:DNA primase [Candidatus Saccharimonadales bacterium]